MFDDKIQRSCPRCTRMWLRLGIEGPLRSSKDDILSWIHTGKLQLSCPLFRLRPRDSIDREDMSLHSMEVLAACNCNLYWSNTGKD